MTTPEGPYATAIPFFPAALPQWLDDLSAQRLTAYQVYYDIYWTAPGAFKLMQRGSEATPIYIPSGRVIANTMNRYAGKGWGVAVDPALGTPNDQALLVAEIAKLFRRERMQAQYNSNKLFGIVKGDWAFRIVADPLKPQGRRISIHGVDPGTYFPLHPVNDVSTIWGCDIVELVPVGDKTYIKRQRYLKWNHPEHPNTGSPDAPVAFQKDYLEQEGWQGPDAKPFNNPDDEAVPLTVLPASITALPVYHIRNFEEPQEPFGSSELRGLERVMAAVNQGISDEELALALEGLGMYVTDAGPPTDEAGNEVPWYLGPGRVVEIGTGKNFNRVSGINTVGPYQEHLGYLHDWLGRTSGASDVAQGVVDVTVAESGIALGLRMGPIIGAAEEKDLGIHSTMDQFLYDLRNWLAEYEGINVGDAQVVSTFGSKLPMDVSKRFDQLLAMYNSIPPLITGAYFRDACREMGLDIPIEVNGAAVIAEQQAFQEAADQYAMRLAEEQAEAGVGEEEGLV